MLVHGEDNGLVVATPGNKISEVSIYNIYGSLLYAAKNTCSESIKIDIEKRRQVLIVHITTNEGIKASKRIIH